MNYFLYKQSISEIKHIFRIMKITVIVLFACFCNLFATEANSQNAKVSIHADNLSLREIIYKIEKQTEYLFVYDRNKINVNRQISLNADNESVSEILNKIFTGTDVAYKLVGKNVTLIKRDDLSHQNGISQQSTKKITGIVTDEKGEPIIGANIVEKGITNGCITDLDGKFIITNMHENAILQVSYIGYLTQEIKISNQTHLKIIMKEDSETLDEVVVVRP